MFTSRRHLVIFSATLLIVSACRKPQPPAPAPVAGPNADSIAAANTRRDAAARAEAARKDSIARAEAMRRDSLARAEAARRAAADAAHATTVLLAAVYFDFQKDDLRPEAQRALDDKAAILREHPGLRIRISGHTDDRGSDEYNLALGQRRAAAALRYLVARGIAAERIAAESFGEQKPDCVGDTEDCWQRNRRDAFVITAGSVGSGTTSGGR